MDETIETNEITEIPEVDETIETNGNSLPFTTDDVIKTIALTLLGCVVKKSFDVALEKGTPAVKKALADRKAKKVAKKAEKDNDKTQLIGVK